MRKEKKHTENSPGNSLREQDENWKCAHLWPWQSEATNVQACMHTTLPSCHRHPQRIKCYSYYSCEVYVNTLIYFNSLISVLCSLCHLHSALEALCYVCGWFSLMDADFFALIIKIYLFCLFWIPFQRNVFLWTLSSSNLLFISWD